MLWGRAIAEHYRFNKVGRDTAAPLARVAKRFPDWSMAAQHINAAMLCRHIASLQSRSGWNIEDHPGRSEVRDRGRPIQATDLKRVLEWAAACTVEIEGTRLPRRDHDIPPQLLA